ncbi:unnamed protein product [marine sediment metagenome]|uniref:Peptidase M20 dimerisation domain-containing protein n=1 Tax=marine sediment metagenome TaxID=412755 RepID=X1VYN9_9ZZZZ
MVKIMGFNVKKVTKEEPVIKGMEGSCDLSRFVICGKIPTVVFGPGDVKRAHSVNEFVEVEEIIKAPE